MAALLLVAHAPLASALEAVATHVFPDCGARVAAVDVHSQSDLQQVQAQLREAIGRLRITEVLILADVFGATPCNAALQVADGLRVRVVSGVNVPMLWRCLSYADEPLDRLVLRAVDGGSQGVLQVASPRRMDQTAAPLSHDQVLHHDQQ